MDELSIDNRLIIMTTIITICLHHCRRGGGRGGTGSTDCWAPRRHTGHRAECHHWGFARWDYKNTQLRSRSSYCFPSICSFYVLFSFPCTPYPCPYCFLPSICTLVPCFPSIVWLKLCPAAEDMEAMAIQLDDGRIGYIYGETLLQAISNDQDPVLNASSKFVCRFPNCDKSYSSVNHLKVSMGLLMTVFPCQPHRVRKNA